MKIRRSLSFSELVCDLGGNVHISSVTLLSGFEAFGVCECACVFVSCEYGGHFGFSPLDRTTGFGYGMLCRGSQCMCSISQRFRDRD